MKIIFPVNKKEMEYFVENGVRFGENGISSTGKENGRHKYYVCPSPRNLKLHREYEKMIGLTK